MTPAELVEETILLSQGTLTNTGALAIDTGEFTGRSPQDKFIVKDASTENSVWWSQFNIPFDSDKFTRLYERMCAHLNGREVYVRDAYVCADPRYRMNVRVVTEFPWSNMFASNMFLRPTAEELTTMTPEWHVICAPEFMADPEIDGTRQHNFAIIDFTKKMAIIGGTGYTGEIKKGIFTFVQIDCSSYLLNNYIPTVYRPRRSHKMSKDGICGKHVSDFFHSVFFQYRIFHRRHNVENLIVNSL
jgi:phosphoenolpyruvate carboxykinase (ATP)